MRPFLRIFTIAAALLGTGCAPLVNRPGAPIAAPSLNRASFTAADGAVLPVRAWLPVETPAKAVIVALHGFNDYSHFFAEPGR
jgi:hypothetical protein